MPKILLAEEDRVLREAAYAALRREGFNVVAVTNGEDALAAAREAPDLILLDVIMPRLDGYQVLRTLKGNMALSRIPVILLTNLGRDSDQRDVLAAGAAAYAVKANITLEALVKLVRKTLAAAPPV